MQNEESRQQGSIAKTDRHWYLNGSFGLSGPHTESEVTRMLRSGEAALTDRIWKSDFQDWQSIDQVELFKKTRRDSTSPIVSAFRKPDSLISSTLIAPSESIILPWEMAERKTLQKRRPRNVGLAFAGGLIVAMFFAWTAKNQLISVGGKIPQGLSQAEFWEMKAALSEDPARGSAVAIGQLAQESGAKFAVARNLSAGDVTELTISGISESLVGAFGFNQKYHLDFNQDGVATVQVPGPLPKGRYQISVQCSSCAQPVILKEYFLGGPQDEIYDSELRASHEALREKARHELQEMSQISMTLAAQAESDHSQRFSSPSELNQVRKQWPAFDQHWQQLQIQLEALIDAGKGSPQNPIFYSEGYQELQQIRSEVTTGHLAMTRLLNETRPTTSLLKALAVQQEALKAHLDQFSQRLKNWESRPLTANGMPRK